MFNTKPSLKIVATLLVRNEADILRSTIEHHLRQGVSQIILTDNNSTDGSREIAEKFPEVVEIIDEPEATHHQSKWVTRMAKLACKLNPDWIIHLDADELWVGLHELRQVKSPIAACEKMYLHPPTTDPFCLRSQRFFLDLDHLPLPQERKIAHRPNPDLVIVHGNHGVLPEYSVEMTNLARHHYPIRSLEQWERKTVQGCEALRKRKSPCDRWEKWFSSWENGELPKKFQLLCDSWRRFREDGTSGFMEMLELWSTDEVIELFKNQPYRPKIGEWPAGLD